jgi:hypothetical protein
MGASIIEHNKVKSESLSPSHPVTPPGSTDGVSLSGPKVIDADLETLEAADKRDQNDEITTTVNESLGNRKLISSLPSFNFPIVDIVNTKQNTSTLKPSLYERRMKESTPDWMKDHIIDRRGRSTDKNTKTNPGKAKPTQTLSERRQKMPLPKIETPDEAKRQLQSSRGRYSIFLTMSWQLTHSRRGS